MDETGPKRRGDGSGGRAAAMRVPDEIDALVDFELVPANVPGRARQPAPSAEPRLPVKQPRLTVAWGDLTRVPADLHVVGHYQDVLPVAAERALDIAISGGAERGIITEHTRRRWIVGRLGEIAYFPSSHPTVRTAAVAAMGRHGTFNERAAERLYASLMAELARLRHVRRAAMVLIGSGEGNLTVAQATRAVVAGFGHTLLGLSEPPALDEVVIVEVDRFRADKIHRALRKALDGPAPPVLLSEEIAAAGQGTVSLQGAAVYAALALASVSDASSGGERSAGAGGAVAEPVRGVLGRVPEEFRAEVGERLRELARLSPADLDVKVGDEAGPVSGQVPVRISVLPGVGSLRWAAITERATVPERQVTMNEAMFEDLVRRLSRPTLRDAGRLPQLLLRMLIPEDFQPLINDQAPLVLELERFTARLHWELLSDGTAEDDAAEPLVLRTPLARQLRTGYTRMAINETPVARLRALVIGDPGDPAKDHSLPGARAEALAVAAQLRRSGVEVTAFVGAPTAGREGVPEDILPASRLDVLGELLSGNYEIVHYSGHGTFDDKETRRRAGWMFSDGLLTSVELSNLSRAPRLVVANACHTSRLGTSYRVGGDRPGAAEGAPPPPVVTAADTELNPALADEFLRSGVVHYLGAAWEIPDPAGVAFSEALYAALLQQQRPVGQAVQEARRTLWKRQNDWGTAWAAYQHYGDPVDLLSTEFPTSERNGG